MKKLLVLLTLSLLTLPAQANELVHNSDFSRGSASWQGDGRSDSSVDPDAPSITAQAAGGGGLVVKLNSHEWTKVYQDFDCHAKMLNFVVEYKLDPDSKFSVNKEDYANPFGAIGYNAWRAMPVPVGTWMIFLSDPSHGDGNYYEIKFDPSKTDKQSYSNRMQMSSSDSSTKTITLAFPPGTGTVRIFKVSVTDN